MTEPIDLTQQREPAEVITLEQFWARMSRGETIEPTTLVLVSVARLQAVQNELDKMKAAQARLDEITEERRRLLAQGAALFGSKERNNAC